MFYDMMEHENICISNDVISYYGHVLVNSLIKHLFYKSLLDESLCHTYFNKLFVFEYIF